MEVQIKRLRGELNEGKVTDKDITRNYGSKLKDITRYDNPYDGATIEFRFHGNVGVELFVKGEAYDIYIDGEDTLYNTTKRATSKHKGKTLKSVSDDNDGGIILEFTDGSKCKVSITGSDYTYSLDRI
tara:strand:+ start:1214 stop:1597 length:384 start_codon:yes stop_codon:yes gene_type:complete